MQGRIDRGAIVRYVGRARTLIPQGELGRGVLTLLAGTMIAQGILIVSAPILTRLYAPSEFGTYAVAMSVLVILITVSSLGYQFAIPLPESDVSAANVLAVCFLATLCLSLALGVVLWLVGSQLLGLFGASPLGPYVMLLPLGQIGGSFVTALTYWAVRTKKFSAIAATNLTQSGTIVAVQIGLGAAGLGALGMLVGDITGRFSGSIRLAREAWRSNAEALKGVTRAGMLVATKRYRRFPLFSMPAAIVNTLGTQAPLLLLVALYGTEVGGTFALANRLAGLPVTLLSGAVGRVFFAEGARLARDNPAALRALFGQTTRSLVRVSIGPFALLAILAPVLAGPVFGDEWAEAGLYVSILTPMYFLILVTNPTGSTLDFLERQDLQLALGLLRIGLVSSATVVASALRLPPVGAIGLLSLAGCLTYSAYGVGSWRAILVRDGRTPTGVTSDEHPRH